MKIPLLALACLAAVTCQAEPSIVTTVVSYGFITNQAGVLINWPVTNVVRIPNGQAARVSAMKLSNQESLIYFSKAGSFGPPITFGPSLGDVIQGPVDFTVVANADSTLLTLERWTVRKSK